MATRPAPSPQNSENKQSHFRAFLGLLCAAFAAVMLLKSTLEQDALHAALCIFFIGLSWPFLKKKQWGPFPRFGFVVTGIYIAFTLFLYFFTNHSVSELVAAFSSNLSLKDALQVGLLTALYEELFFRGQLQQQLFKVTESFSGYRKIFWAVYLNGLIFWAFHLPVSLEAWQWALSRGGIPLGPGPFLLGLTCSFIAFRDRGIFGAVAFHATANLAGVLWQDIIRNEDVLRMFYSLH